MSNIEQAVRTDAEFQYVALELTTDGRWAFLWPPVVNPLPYLTTGGKWSFY